MAYGYRTLVAAFRLETEADLTRYSHPHKQTGCFLSGEIALKIGDEPHQFKPGEVWCAVGGLEDKAIVLPEILGFLLVTASHDMLSG